MVPMTLLEALKTHPFLSDFRQQDLEKIASLASEVHFARDEIIFREGTESTFFYVLLSGRVALEVAAQGKNFRVQTVGEGDELGWSSFLTPSRKSFQARSLDKVHALQFDASRLLAACDEEPEFGYRLMRRLLYVVGDRLRSTRVQLMDLYLPAGARK